MVILTSNYTVANASDDFATPYLKFIMKFIGIDDATFIDATGLANGQSDILARAQGAIKAHCIEIATNWNKQTAAE